MVSILALGIVREPTVWGVITSKYSCTHDIERANVRGGGGRWQGGSIREIYAWYKEQQQAPGACGHAWGPQDVLDLE